MHEKLRTIAVIGCLLAVIIVCYNAGERIKGHILNGRETAGSVSGSGTLVVLDAGHGGVDAGKTGINGAEEKRINYQTIQYI